MTIDAVRLNEHQSFNESLAVETGKLFLHLIYKKVFFTKHPVKIM